MLWVNDSGVSGHHAELFPRQLRMPQFGTKRGRKPRNENERMHGKTRRAPRHSAPPLIATAAHGEEPDAGHQLREEGVCRGPGADDLPRARRPLVGRVGPEFGAVGDLIADGCSWLAGGLAQVPRPRPPERRQESQGIRRRARVPYHEDLPRMLDNPSCSTCGSIGLASR